jgi:hypothetical protein
VNLYPLREENEQTLPETVFPAGTILSCPECGEGLYRLTARVSLVDVVLDEGRVLVPLNLTIPSRAVWKALACPFCDTRLYKDGKVHTLQAGWR